MTQHENRYAPDVLHNMAAEAAQSSRLVEAFALLREASALAPQSVPLLIDIARVASDLADHESSILATRRALRLEPNNPIAMMLLAESLRQTERFSEAVPLYDRIRSLAPETRLLDHCTAVALSGLHRYDEAEAYYRRALAAPDPISLTNWEFAHLLLRRGNFAEGWDAYYQRFESGKFANIRCYEFHLPRWRGESLADKTVLIHGEQGLGDQIMFASIINEIIAAGARVYLAVSYELVDLFADSFPTIPVYGILRDQDAARWWSALPQHIDYQIPMGDLPVFTRRNESSYPRTPYLRTNARRVSRIQRYLSTVCPNWDDRKAHPMRIGLMWASNPATFDWRAARRGRRKTIPVDLLGRLASIENALFISLQNRQSAKQAAHIPYIDTIDCSQTLDTLADTAALMQQLDAIITVDTSIAHLAGGMGLRTYTALAYDADWRWLIDRRDSVWYSNMHLVRQVVDGDWAPVVGEITDALLEIASPKRMIPTIRSDGKRTEGRKRRSNA